MNPYWLEDEIPPRPSARIEGRVDVAIVGGGVTGCSAALRLAEEGLRVRLYEQRGIAEGASGRNGGFALPGGATSYDTACETYGRETAQRFWRWTEEEAVLLAELAGDAEERDRIRAEYEALRADGFAVEWRDDLDGVLAGRYHGVIVHAAGG